MRKGSVQMVRAFRENENGAVIVFVALVMTVLLGFASFVVEYGYLLNERSLLQNAVDAAALAGVVDGEAAAREYVMKNTTGVSSTDVSVVANTQDVEVSVKKEVPVFFSKLFTGNTTTTVSTSAKAKADFVYAIWAEEECDLSSFSLPLSNPIQGSVHAETVLVDPHYEPEDFITGTVDESEKDMIALPHLTVEAETLNLDHSARVGGSIVIKDDIAASLEPDKIYYVEYPSDPDFRGKLVIQTQHPLNIIYRYDISLASGSFTDVSRSSMLYSVEGDITVDGSILSTLIYASKGVVSLTDTSSYLMGIVICKTFKADSFSGNIVYDHTAAKKLNVYRVSLTD